MAINVTYGEGGYDPTKPNNNIISTEEVPDAHTEVDPALAAFVATLTDDQRAALIAALGA